MPLPSGDGAGARLMREPANVGIEGRHCWGTSIRSRTKGRIGCGAMPCELRSRDAPEMSMYDRKHHAACPALNRENYIPPPCARPRYSRRQAWRREPSSISPRGSSLASSLIRGPHAAVGRGTVIGATAVIGADVQIGRGCSIGPGASIMHALIGDKVIIHPGCRIGQDGLFRYHSTPQEHTKVPQIGRVIIQDGVEIGAGTTIDRGGGGDT
jgi:UDP-3-O-[3-hydroxymyristoyl] glucosamine N-acyltransferase